MTDEPSGDCNTGASLPLEATRLAGLIDRCLVRAGVSEETRAKVQEAAIDLKYVDAGQVSAVVTRPAGRTIYVTGVRGGGTSDLAKLDFPPNDKRFEAELLRAQDSGRVVGMIFSTDSQGRNTIEEVWVYAGSAAGGSARY